MRLDGERRRAGGHVEHGAAAQGGDIEAEEARVLLERTPEEGHGRQLHYGGSGRGCGERWHGMIGLGEENKKPDSEESGSGGGRIFFLRCLSGVR
ncbi:MAG: hypothetical protein WDM96_14500 [Lacunisphaera sp.]